MDLGYDVPSKSLAQFWTHENLENTSASGMSTPDLYEWQYPLGSDENSNPSHHGYPYFNEAGII